VKTGAGDRILRLPATRGPRAVASDRRVANRRPDLAPVLQDGGKSANICPGPGVIRGIPADIINVGSSVHPGGDVGYFLADRLKGFRRTKIYDLFAAAPLIAWFICSAAQMVPQVAEQLALVRLFVQTDFSVLPISLVLSLVSKLCTLVFLAVLVTMFAARRVPQRYAQGLHPRFVAVAGTFISVGIVWLPPRELSSSLYLVSLLLTIGGTAFAVFAVLALARSISIMPEARRLITWGPYTLVRHPLYLGEMVATAGLALQYLMPWALLLLGLNCLFQFERMRIEERVLLQAFPRYRDYMAATARLVPGLY
jgi:protein-S-isoprenylcysteine O-methyltransferase Ste14